MSWKSLIHLPLVETDEGHFTRGGAGFLQWLVSIIMSDILSTRRKYHYGELGAATTIQPLMGAPSWKQRILDYFLLLSLGSYGKYRERFMRAHTNGGLHITTGVIGKDVAGMEW
jgi:hypothetical protein